MGFTAKFGCWSGLSLIRKIVLFGLVTWSVMAVAASSASAAEDEERVGEIGIQIGLRWVDRDIVPDDSRGFGWSPGASAAWALGDRWALFGDLNQSVQDSILFCRQMDACSAYTPETKIKVFALGFERRFKPGPKGGRWVLGLAPGWIDVEWRGTQLHKGMVSVGFGRRMPLGPGFLRLWLRVETGVGIGTDDQLAGALERFRMTNVTLLVGWGAGIWKRR